LNEAVTTEDPDKIQEALEKLKNSSMEIGKAMYAQQSADSEQQPEENQEEEKPAEEEKTEEEKKAEEEKKDESK